MSTNPFEPQSALAREMSRLSPVGTVSGAAQPSAQNTLGSSKDAAQNPNIGLLVTRINVLEMKMQEILMKAQQQEQAFQRIPSSVGRSFVISDKIKLEMTGSSILFFPDGQMDQQRIYLCQEEKCWTISTQEQRGRVRIFDSKIQ